MKAFGLFLALVLAGGAAEAQTKGKAAIRRQEQSAEKFLQAYMKAYGELSRTRDIGSITKFLSRSFTAISDGARGDYESAKRGWSRYLDRLNRGEMIDHKVDLTDLRAQVSGNVAWVTYTYKFRETSGDKVVASQKGVCTEVLVQTNGKWLIEHEHCTSTPDGR